MTEPNVLEFRTIGHYGSTILDCDGEITSRLDISGVNPDNIIVKAKGRQFTTFCACVKCGKHLIEFVKEDRYFHPYGLEFGNDQYSVAYCDQCVSYDVMSHKMTFKRFKRESDAVLYDALRELVAIFPSHDEELHNTALEHANSALLYFEETHRT